MVNPLATDNMVLLQDSHQALVNIHLDQVSLLAMATMGLSHLSVLPRVNMDLAWASVLILNNTGLAHVSHLALDNVVLDLVNVLAMSNMNYKRVVGQVQVELMVRTVDPKWAQPLINQEIARSGQDIAKKKEVGVAAH